MKRRTSVFTVLCIGIGIVCVFSVADELRATVSRKCASPTMPWLHDAEWPRWTRFGAHEDSVYLSRCTQLALRTNGSPGSRCEPCGVYAKPNALRNGELVYDVEPLARTRIKQPARYNFWRVAEQMRLSRAMAQLNCTIIYVGDSTAEQLLTQMRCLLMQGGGTMTYHRYIEGGPEALCVRFRLGLRADDGACQTLTLCSRRCHELEAACEMPRRMRTMYGTRSLVVVSTGHWHHTPRRRSDWYDALLAFGRAFAPASPRRRRLLWAEPVAAHYATLPGTLEGEGDYDAMLAQCRASPNASRWSQTRALAADGAPTCMLRCLPRTQRATHDWRTRVLHQVRRALSSKRLPYLPMYRLTRARADLHAIDRMTTYNRELRACMDGDRCQSPNDTTFLHDCLHSRAGSPIFVRIIGNALLDAIEALLASRLQ